MAASERARTQRRGTEDHGWDETCPRSSGNAAFLPQPDMSAGLALPLRRLCVQAGLPVGTAASLANAKKMNACLAERKKKGRKSCWILFWSASGPRAPPPLFSRKLLDKSVWTWLLGPSFSRDSLVPLSFRPEEKVGGRQRT